MTAALTMNFLPLCLLAVLHAHGDEGTEANEAGERFLTQKQIKAFMERDFGLSVNLRSVARNLQNLHEVGAVYPNLGFQLDYLRKDRRASGPGAAQDERLVVHAGWRLVRDSNFETSEVRMMIDTLIASPMIPPHQAHSLINRLKELAFDDLATPEVLRIGCTPVVNKQFFFSLETLNEAIRQRKYVAFFLGSFNQRGELVREDPEGEVHEYVVAPVQMIVSKGRYYFLAQMAPGTDVFKFRVDLMVDVRMTDQDAPLEGSVAAIDVLKFREQHSNKMSGEVLNVVLRVSRHRLHTLFDQFGPHVHFFNEKDETIDVRLQSSFYSVLFWALQYYRYVEVVEPQELRDELERAGRAITEMYEGEPGRLSLGERQ